MKYFEAFAEPGFHTALMTTYRFDSGIFEDVIRPRLRSNGCRNIAVIADRDQLNAGFSETGLPVSAGSRYHLAKRAVTGAFHPKLVLQLGRKSGRLIVGSANLTGAGLYSNLEVLEILKVSQEDRRAAPILAAALAYFEGHTDHRDKAMRHAFEVARSNTEWLRSVTPSNRIDTQNGFVEFITEDSQRTIADRLVDAVAGRNVARVVCAAPFWDGKLEAVRRLQERLSPETVALVVDPEAQDFDASAFRALEGVSLHSASRLPECDRRRFHAKVIIVETEAGDLVLSGSANISRHALLETASTGNAEAGILRQEQAGSAVERLGFNVVLSAAMPLTDLKLRLSASRNGVSDEPKLLDGGALFLDAAALEWQPPNEVDTSKCSIEIFDSLGQSLGVGEPKAIGGRIWIEGLDDLGSAITAEALIDGKRSVRMPIARLSTLKARSNPRSSLRAQKILDQIFMHESVDAELCGQLMRLYELLQEDRSSSGTRDGSSTRDNVEDGTADDRHLDSEEFGQVARDTATKAERETAFRSAYDRIAEILRQLNANPEVISSGGSGGGSGEGDVAAPRARSPEQRQSQLISFLGAILDGLNTKKFEPLSITALTMVQAFITAMRLESADTDSEIGDAKAVGPNKPGGGWIRMLGRCFLGFSEALPDSLSDADIDEEQIEVLAQILSTAKLVFEKAQLENIPVVTKSMGAVLASLNQKLNPAIAGHLGKETLLQEIMQRNDST